MSALSAGHAAFLFICLSGDFFTFVSQVRCLHCWCLPLSAGHAAFLFICLPCDFFTFVSQVRCLYCWCPPLPLATQHFYSFVSQVISLLLSPRFVACTAGVRPLPLAMQHFYSFVSQVISLLLSPRFVACTAGVRPFLLAMQHYYSFVSHAVLLVSALFAGHAAFLFICLPCDFFTFVSQVRCLYCWCPPFLLAMQHFHSFVSHVISSLLSPRLGACTADVRPFRWPCSISVHLYLR